MALRFVIFDLDDTLYSRENGLMQEVGRRIQAWVSLHLNLSWQEARALRWRYFRTYGTTMGGLIAEHDDLDIADYLFYVHDIPTDTYLKPEPALGTMLDSIPLRKAIYTNATSEYGWRVMTTLQVADRFEQVIGIEEVGLRNKPRPDAFERALEMLGADGRACIMVEDAARNLRPAKALGLRTILVAGPARPHEDDDPDDMAAVDCVVQDILAVAGAVSGLLVDSER
jgi:putative hydrolase of the HAD superfamily